MHEEGSSSPDSVELRMEQDNSPLVNGSISPTDGCIDEDYSDLPHLVISQQPQARNFRFRYECEGPSHGGLQGESSQRYRKTFPAVTIKNYTGAAKIVVSLATDETVPKAHAHKLVGRNCNDGICVVENKPGVSVIEFPNMCVQHITKRKAPEVLARRICESLLLTKRIALNDLNAAIELTDADRQQAKKQAEGQAKNMQLNVVRLCFQAYLRDEANMITRLLPSIISTPIYDSKAPGANALKICRMDKYGGCCTGNEEVFLLCEKVQKDDIQVKFTEQDPEGGTIQWEGFGNFGPFDVHRQYAIVFKTPPYWNTKIEQPVNVMIVLQRKSDGEMSDAKSFTYYPQPVDEEDIGRKRMKPLPGSDYKQAGNFDMNHSMDFRSESRNGSNGDSSSNGTQKPGSIPKFDNMSRQRYGQIPPIIAPGPRPRLHAPRTIPSHNMIHRTRQPDQMFSNRNSQFPFGTTASNTVNSVPTYLSANQIPNSSQANYSNHPNQASPGSINELSPQMPDSKSPVMHFINSQVQGHNVNGMSSAGSPYSAASVSPHMASPIQVDSPPQMVAQGNGYLATENFQVPQIKSEIDEFEIKLSIQASGNAAVSQPVQPSSDMAGVESLETDYFQTVEQFLNQFDQQVPPYIPGQQRNTLGQLDAYSEYYGTNTCQYQARSATGGMYDNHALSDMVTVPALDFFDGYDEVDASRLDVVAYPMPTADIELMPQTGKYIRDGDLAHIIPRTTTEVRIAKETVVATEIQSSAEPVVTMETGVQAGEGAPRPVDCEVQTDANPMLKTALRTSQALQSYAASGDIRFLLMVQRYLMSVGDENGDLPLHTALINGKYEVFQNLLDVMVTLPDSYTRINAYNYNHQTPLHLAVLTNQPLAIDLLIRARADPTLVDRNGYSPAHLAVLYGYEDCMGYLLKYVRPDVTHDAPFPELNTRCYEGFTPLHLAAQLESLAMIKLLVRGRANVNIPDGKSGRTALHHAVEADELSIAAFLILQAGAHVNVKRFDGNTPLHIACGRGNVGMVALLMAGGADPDTENDDVHESSGTSSEDDSMSESGEEDDNQDTVDGSTRRNGSSSTQAESTTTTTADGESMTAQTGRRASEPGSHSRRVRCRGMTPADFANCDDKIIRILNGEPYTSLDCRENQNDDPECDQMVSQLKSLQLHSKQESGFGSLGIQSFGGDMYKVDYPTRVSLSKLLDSSKPGSDWLTLADRLNLRKVTEGQTGEQSPTRLLLTYYEECGGTVSRLSNTLCDMNRNDAVNLLNDSTHVSSSVVSGSDKDGSHDEPLDSGFTTDSYLPSHRNPVIT